MTWFAQVRYADQIARYSDNLDRINAKIDNARRKVYSSADIALLENVAALGRTFNIARPWQAEVERSFKKNGIPLNELLLADSTKLSPSSFDFSPLIFPIGDLVRFLSEGPGTHSFSTVTTSSQVDNEAKSWTAGGGGSFLGFSLGGGGSGSSTFAKSVSQLNSIEISFKNISEYYADRSAWFNPAVLQDPGIRKLVNERREIDNLQYVAVSLIIVRGTKLILKFSEKVKQSDWTTQSFSASGGASFLGFSIGGGGGSSRTASRITVDPTGTTVTIEDGDEVGRVLGVRVEPFLQPSKRKPQSIEELSRINPTVKKALEEFQTGKKSYMELQQMKIKALQELQ